MKASLLIPLPFSYISQHQNVYSYSLLFPLHTNHNTTTSTHTNQSHPTIYFHFWKPNREVFLEISMSMTLILSKIYLSLLQDVCIIMVGQDKKDVWQVEVQRKGRWYRKSKARSEKVTGRVGLG
jgi:hypothetical protein